MPLCLVLWTLNYVQSKKPFISIHYVETISKEILRKIHLKKIDFPAVTATTKLNNAIDNAIIENRFTTIFNLYFYGIDYGYGIACPFNTIHELDTNVTMNNTVFDWFFFMKTTLNQLNDFLSSFSSVYESVQCTVSVGVI